MSALLAALLVGGGLAALGTAVVQRKHERLDDLAEILDLPFGERDVAVEALTEHRVVPGIGGAAVLAEVGLRRFDRKSSVAAALTTARIPFSAGEYVVLTAVAAVVAAALVGLVTGNALFGGAGAVAAAYVATVAPRIVARRRRARIEAQLPDALATVAASLEAGHTFLRSIQMLAEEIDAPLSDELAQVVQETALNAPLLDALDRMAERLRIKDFDWVVQAIRIQQSTGGKLSDVLHTLADFMRGREELRREVKVLTAEGRMSATVLGAMPPLLFLTFQAMNPSYAEPLLHGWGLVTLGLAAASTAMGIATIVRMVKIEV